MKLCLLAMTNMFKQIVAIDVAERIPQFMARIESFTKTSAFCAVDANEVLCQGIDLNSIDCILVSIYQPLSIEFLMRCSNLRCISILGTSTQLLPMDYCRGRGITVLSVTEYCDIETAEWVMLEVIKSLRTQSPSQSVFGKTLGIIGMGAVGKRLLSLAHAFGMSVYCNSKSTPILDDRAIKATKEEIFSVCDVVSFHTPPHCPWLTKEMLTNAKQNIVLIDTCMGRLSLGNELEDFLAQRSDVKIIMDRIAGASYQNLRERAHIADEAAFLTMDSENRLWDKFFANLESTLATG